MDEKEMTFKVLNDEGKEVECEVLFTYESKETNKNYIVYTDNSIDEEGNTKVFASTFNPDEDETLLSPIETEEEWRILEDILEKLQSEDGVSDLLDEDELSTEMKDYFIDGMK